jgi:hypothetical protein
MYSAITRALEPVSIFWLATLVGQVLVDRVPPIHAHHDGDHADHDEEGGCDEPSDLQCLAHNPTPFEPISVS